MGSTSKRYSAEVRERAVRMVAEHREEYGSQWAAIQSIAGKLGMAPETLRLWLRRYRRPLLLLRGGSAASRGPAEKLFDFVAVGHRSVFKVQSLRFKVRCISTLNLEPGTLNWG